ncbi:MAG: hypothetical protein IPN86_04480 [Saprospiraceae bacterium]|nr:hypothetical protein [Saprospiraceae bacterium]
MANKGTNITDIKQVASHPMAINQCRKFLKSLSHHWKLIESEDTA